MSDVNRVHAGSPDGGQFARGDDSRQEPGQLLIPDDDQLDGSFEYPPLCDTAEKSYRFWSHCPIPDEVLRTLQVQQQKFKMSEGLRAGNDAIKWYRTQCAMRGVQRDPAHEEELRKKGMEDGGATVPIIPRHWLAPVVRASMMYRDAEVYARNEDEKQRLLDARLRFGPSKEMGFEEAGDMTVKDVYDYFQMDNYHRDILDAPEKERQRLQDVHAKLDVLAHALQPAAEDDPNGLEL